MSKVNRVFKLLVLVTLIGMMSVSFMSCSKESVDNSEETPAAEVSNEVKDIEAAFAEGPIMITSAGQSADFDIAMTLMDKAEIEYKSNGVLQSTELGDNKTLVVAVGGSSKGLGAAGIDVNDELKRVEDVIEQAKTDGLNIIALHTGGEGRRGDLSDKFVNAVLPKANYIIAVSTGDSDGLLTELASQNDVPMSSVDTIVGVIESLKRAFK